MPLGKRYSLCVISNILFSFLHISHSFESAAWFCLLIMQFCSCSHLLHTGELIYLSLWCPNLWQIWHLNGFGMYVATLEIIYHIFTSVKVLGVLKPRIYICLDYFVFFYGDSLGIGNTLFVKVTLYFIKGAMGKIWTSHYTLWWVKGDVGVGFYSKIIKVFLF